MKSDEKHLHYIAPVADTVKLLWSVLFPVLIGFAFSISHLRNVLHYVLPALAVLLVIFIFNLLRWLRFTYTLDDDQVRIRSGLLVRNDRYIRIGRIQSVQIKTNALLRLFGIVQLKFDTADPESKGDMTLSALSSREAERIKAAVSRAKTQSGTSEPAVMQHAEQEHPAKKIYTLSGRQLLLASLIASRVGVMIMAVFGLWSQADDIVPDSIKGRSLSYVEHASLVVLILLAGAVIFLLWLCSLISILLRWGGFRLAVYDDEWRIRHGVWETRDEVYKTDRVQALQIKEQWLQQLFGWCSIYAKCSGSVDQENEGEDSVLLFPLVRKKDVPEFLEHVLPRLSGAIRPQPLPVRGCLYRMIFPTVFWMIVVTALSWWLSWGKYLFIALPFLLGYCWFMFRTEGWAVDGDRLITADRFLARRTTITAKRHIQSFAKEQSYLRERLGIASVSATIRASSAETLTVSQMNARDAQKLFLWFRNRKQAK